MILVASYISIFPYDILVYESILEVSGFQMLSHAADAVTARVRVTAPLRGVRAPGRAGPGIRQRQPGHSLFKFELLPGPLMAALMSLVDGQFGPFHWQERTLDLSLALEIGRVGLE